MSSLLQNDEAGLAAVREAHDCEDAVLADLLKRAGASDRGGEAAGAVTCCLTMEVRACRAHPWWLAVCAWLCGGICVARAARLGSVTLELCRTDFIELSTLRQLLA